MNFYPLNVDPIDAPAGSGGVPGLLLSLLPIIIMFLVMYFLLIKPQKKREKEAQNMRNSLQIGDEVVTAGGIVGRVVSLKDDTILVETGSDKNKIRIKRWAVQANQVLQEPKEAAPEIAKQISKESSK